MTPDEIKVWSQYAPGVYEVALNGARIGSVQRHGRDDWSITECAWSPNSIHLLPFKRRGDAVRLLCLTWKLANA